MNRSSTSLIDRYVYAVQRLLPRAQRDDIVAELREILRSQVDEEEAEARRPLQDREISAILKGYGRPREVAMRYGSRQYLIGPEMFPSYAMAVKVVLWLLIPVTLFLLLVTAVTTEKHLLPRLLGTLWTAVTIALVNIGIVTLMFVYFGNNASANLATEDWEVDDLPPLPSDPDTFSPKSEAIGSLVGLSLMLCWWLGVNDALRWLFGWEPLPVIWAPIWTDLTLTAVAILIASMVREGVGLLRPHRTRPYLVSGIILNVLALLVLFRLLSVGNHVWVAVSAQPTSMGALAFLLNGLVRVGLIIMSLIVMMDSGRDVWRLLRPCAIRFRASA
jgi:hypothetical protein